MGWCVFWEPLTGCVASRNENGLSVVLFMVLGIDFENEQKSHVQDDLQERIHLAEAKADTVFLRSEGKSNCPQPYSSFPAALRSACQCARGKHPEGSPHVVLAIKQLLSIRLTSRVQKTFLETCKA